MTSLPIVDVSEYSINIKEESLDYQSRPEISNQLKEAFQTVGFVYLINHGISIEEVDEVNRASAKFFHFPREVKQKYSRQGSGANQGWISLEEECLNPERPGDYKEAYNCTPAHKQIWPDEEVPEFRKEVKKFQENCQSLTHRVLALMATGLGLDPSFFKESHQNVMEGATTLRCLYYPPLPQAVDLKKNQIRCGEHSDYGSITLLFQDDVGGLQVRHRDGSWIDATPVPGAVLVNIGDLMQRWTADKLVSTKHRVLIPDSEASYKVERQSLAYFVHPSDDGIVEPVDGSGKYPPITGVEYLNQRFAATYSY